MEQLEVIKQLMAPQKTHRTLDALAFQVTGQAWTREAGTILTQRQDWETGLRSQIKMKPNLKLSRKEEE